MTTPDPKAIAAKLTEVQRECTLALCGNAWDWKGGPSPGLILVATLGFMRSRRLGNNGKSTPTPLGLAVRAEIEKEMGT